MLKFCNMKITLKRVEDCVVFIEKTQISLAEQRKARGDRKNVKDLLILHYNLFYSCAMKPSYL